MLLLLPFMLTMGAAMHPYYVDVTEIRIDSKKHTLQLSCKMFTDDLQDALHRKSRTKVNIMKNDTVGRRLIEAYIRNHISLKIGSQPVALDFIGYEIEEEACWSYFEAPAKSISKIEASTKQIKKIEVTSTLLFEEHETQTHLIHCYFDGVRKSAKLVNPEAKAEFAR